jgi:hypothetical protein
MKDWQIRQDLYHRLNTEHSDDLSLHHIEMTDNVVENAIRYFNKRDIGWIYPSKSYMVGICYARWLSEEFGGEPIDYLNEEDLLYGNDPYFVTYDKDKDTYDEILSKIGGWNFKFDGMVSDVKEYFNEEFMIENF